MERLNSVARQKEHDRYSLVMKDLFLLGQLLALAQMIRHGNLTCWHSYVIPSLMKLANGIIIKLIAPILQKINNYYLQHPVQARQ